MLCFQFQPAPVQYADQSRHQRGGAGGRLHAHPQDTVHAHRFLRQADVHHFVGGCNFWGQGI